MPGPRCNVYLDKEDFRHILFGTKDNESEVELPSWR